MKHLTRLGWLSLAIGLGFAAVLFLLVGLSPAVAIGSVDLTVEMEAPAHIEISSTFLVRIAYFNYGSVVPADAWVTAVLPPGTQLISATDRWGEPLPPDAASDNTSGYTLTWGFDSPHCHAPLDACCGHILITLRPDQDLLQGTALTTTAFITTSDIESDLTNNHASVVSIAGDMGGSIKQVHARHVTPGGVLTYTVIISMARQPGGIVEERWVTLTDTLPFSNQVRFLGWNGPVSGTLTDDHVLHWQGQIEAGEPFLLQYRLGVEGVITPGEIITNVAMLGWGNGHMTLGPVTTVVSLPNNVMVLEPGEGGQLQHAHGVTLSVPPGVVTDTTVFQLGPLFTDTYPSVPPEGLLFANRAFELAALCFGDPVVEFSDPLTITLSYTDADVEGLKHETLGLWTRGSPDQPWAMLGQPARVMSGLLTYNITHLSQFALFAEGLYRFYLPLLTQQDSAQGSKPASAILEH